MRKPEVRRRYWARATIGWQRFRGARPNAAHRALAALEAAGRLAGVITQNVDRLHSEAGSRRVVELHGALADVRCLGCGASNRAQAVHERLLAANPGWLDGRGDVIRYAPDGDAELPAELVDGFQVVDCAALRRRAQARRRVLRRQRRRADAGGRASRWPTRARCCWSSARR